MYYSICYVWNVKISQMCLEVSAWFAIEARAREVFLADACTSIRRGKASPISP
jgi:hypothetical protein